MAGETIQTMFVYPRPQRCYVARELYAELHFFVSRPFEPDSTRIIVPKRFATPGCLTRRFCTFEMPTTQA